MHTHTHITHLSKSTEGSQQCQETTCNPTSIWNTGQMKKPAPWLFVAACRKANFSHSLLWCSGYFNLYIKPGMCCNTYCKKGAEGTSRNVPAKSVHSQMHQRKCSQWSTFFVAPYICKDIFSLLNSDDQHHRAFLNVLGIRDQLFPAVWCLWLFLQYSHNLKDWKHLTMHCNLLPSLLVKCSSTRS